VATHPIRGVALAGGGPLGAIYEIGALLALGETLRGFDLTGCGVYVGVSSGAFIAAGLANGLSPKSMHRMFIESDADDDPFEPSLLLRLALGEYANRLASLPRLVSVAARQYLEPGGSAGFFESFGRLAHALPTGIFDNAGVGDYLTQLLSGSKRTNDFRQLKHKLFLVATDIDTGAAVPFGADDWDDVPIARAVQASAALPGLFPPVEIGGRFYVDGALTKTLHASVALRKGAKLLLCINPLVPFDARLAAERAHRNEVSVVHGGLPAIMSQTFRTLIYSRMRVSMARYRTEYPDADVLLFEPERDDAEMFFTNVFSYSDRRRLCEHAYQRTREDLRRRRSELGEALGRHGITIDDEALADEHRTLLVRGHRKNRRPPDALGQTTAKLDQTLDRLERLVTTRAAPERDQQAS
jgi:predicted acylesterase/phospholipase RssA